MKFGGMIIVTAKLVRDNRPMSVDGQRNYRNGYHAYWRTQETAPRRVLMIGRRTLYNGNVHYDYDHGNLFTHKESVPAILVVADERTKPFYVPIDHAREEVDNEKSSR